MLAILCKGNQCNLLTISLCRKHSIGSFKPGCLYSKFPFLALRSFLVGITRTKALNMAALTAVLVNIPGNWLLIFHWEMGYEQPSHRLLPKRVRWQCWQSMFYVKWINGFMACLGASIKVCCSMSAVCPYGACSIRLSA